MDVSQGRQLLEQRRLWEGAVAGKGIFTNRRQHCEVGKAEGRAGRDLDVMGEWRSKNDLNI